jgi:formylglycine-generating enzyme required for sulfatase activity
MMSTGQLTSCFVVALLALPAGPRTVTSQHPKPKDGPLGVKFVPLPAATTYLGWNGEAGSAKQTEIKGAFEIATHEVTQSQWQAVMGTNPSWFSRTGERKNWIEGVPDEDLNHFPVEAVTWVQAREFIRKLNELEKGRGYRYRLPTTAEWEYASRNGATTEDACSYHFYFDEPTNDLSSKQANFRGNMPFGKAKTGPDLFRPAKVGSYPPNKLGLYDMHGNVSEWCEDGAERGLDRNRLFCGGSWFLKGEQCRASSRVWFAPTGRTSDIGFRLVRVPADARNDDPKKADGTKPAGDPKGVRVEPPPKPKDGPLGTKFVPLPKATFYMGWGKDGEPGGAKKTELTEAFEIAVHEVTQGQWQDVMGDNPSRFTRTGIGRNRVKDVPEEELKHHPVEPVRWVDAKAFIAKLNERERGKGYVYRLPTMAEWEYACRGGATTEDECSYHFYFAEPTNDLSSNEANFNGSYPYGNARRGPYRDRTTKVGSYPPNKLGLYDMYGNVYEWCEDAVDTGDKREKFRAFKGGSWFDGGHSLFTADRGGFAEGASGVAPYGFRLVRVPAR